MAIKVSGTDVITNARELANIATLDATTKATIFLAPTAPNQTAGDDSTNVANTAFVTAALAGTGPYYTTTISVTGTWTKPASLLDTQVVRIQRWGGGGGGSRDGNGYNGTGGSGGGYLEDWVTGADMGATEAATIGAGGIGRTGSEGVGTDGGDTTFMSRSATGGGGGQRSGNASAPGGPQGIITPSALVGGEGGSRLGNYKGVGGTSIYGGGGGAKAGRFGESVSVYAGAGGGTTNNGNGVDGSIPSGGGGGCEDGYNAGDGARGQIIITAFG